VCVRRCKQRQKWKDVADKYIIKHKARHAREHSLDGVASEFWGGRGWWARVALVTDVGALLDLLPDEAQQGVRIEGSNQVKVVVNLRAQRAEGGQTRK